MIAHLPSVAIPLVLLAALPTAVLAQDSPASQAVEGVRSEAPGWNSTRVLELVERAREVRRAVVVDSAFQSYRAEARGRVYFFVDRPDSEEHVLVKADQVALEVYWRAPDEARQRIVGQRDEKVLPTNIRYHLDHLTVVQDDYGDFIRLGDGDEVEAVLHPVGPRSNDTYDFQLVDSLSLRYGMDGAEVRVYEIQVRPKRLDRPGYIGTLFVDRATASIVRMNFTFTPASYVDDYLDYIRISLDNSLWMGRYWLPYRQEIELRREMPLLDFSAGSVIRSRFDIRAYDFNVTVPDFVWLGPSVGATPLSQRRAFAFDRGIFDEIDEEGLTMSTTMEDVRTQVREVVEDEVLSGLAPLRLHIDGLSDFARYNRAEGVYLGGGLTLRPWSDWRVRTSAGYAFGRRRAAVAVAATGDGPVAPSIAGYVNRLEDVGGNPGASPLENSIGSASGSKDYLDPYFATGGRISFGSPALGRRAALSFEEHRGATDVVSDGPDTEFRPVRSIHEGRVLSLALTGWLDLPGDGRAEVTAVAGRLEPTGGGVGADRSLVGLRAGTEWPVRTSRDAWFGMVRAQGGVINPGAPAQSMFLLGGRHTLPGHDYRSFTGNGYWLARVEATVPVRRPYVGLRAFGVAGATYLGSVSLPADWSATDSNGVRGSLGLGLSLGWDTLFLDLAHGVNGGGWEAVFSVSEQFQGWM